LVKITLNCETGSSESCQPPDTVCTILIGQFEAPFVPDPGVDVVAGFALVLVETEEPEDDVCVEDKVELEVVLDPVVEVEDV